MKLETSEGEREAFKKFLFDQYGNSTNDKKYTLAGIGVAALRDIDALLAEVERLRAGAPQAVAPPAPPLPAEVEEMRGRILVALLHAAIRASNDEGHKMAAYFDSVRDEAASLLSRWPGRWRPIETAPKDGMAFLICDARTGSYNVVSYVDVGSDYCWEIVDSSVRLHAEWGTHWSPLPEPPHE